MNAIYAGPWMGEFGWELMGWQATIRQRARGYRKVVIGCRPSSRAIYEDFATSFVDVPYVMNNCNWFTYDGEHKAHMARFAQRAGGHKWIQPQTFTPCEGGFVRYGENGRGERYDVLFHARDITKGDQKHPNFGAHRNWSPAHWHLVAIEMKLRGLLVASVGLRGHAHHVMETDDRRDVPLRELMDLMANAGLMVGPSSGPIHLAALCGCPHIVWTNRKKKAPQKQTNESRLRSWWNPFGTPVTLIDGWNPDPVEVIETIAKKVPS